MLRRILVPWRLAVLQSSPAVSIWSTRKKTAGSTRHWRVRVRLLRSCRSAPNPRQGIFRAANRIISGIALGVVVVEAAARSGSLITARYALEQGREVFAVPGSPLDPRCRGCNDLLRHGAIQTENADDVLSHLRPDLEHIPPPVPAAPASTPSADHWPNPVMNQPISEDVGLELVVEKLGTTPVAVDELVRQCHLSAAAVATFLLELELAGRVERHPGNLVSLR